MQMDVRSLFDLVERQRDSLEDAAQEMNCAQLQWTPGSGAWNTAQTIEHLVLSDETVGVAHAAGAVPCESWPLRIVPGSLRFAMVVRALSRDVALPLPSRDVAPQGTIPLPELLS